ncbi:MAG: hypothetical protein JXM69_17595 [Anaerolineae bacterium]|nr:hypothetical protein [Anaerolineae bacterium]
MSKKKKQKKSNIPIQTLARPRLEKILTRYQQGELDGDEYIAAIETLITEISREAILEALIGLLDGADNERKDALMVAIPKLGDETSTKHLWQLVRRSKLSMGAKMTALVILKQMGEDVDLDNPGEYFSWRDIKQADLDEVASMGRFGLHAIIKELQKMDNPDDVEAIMFQFEDITKAGGADAIQVIAEDLIKMGDAAAADMLAAIAATTTYANIRKTARKGLLKLSGQNVFPQTASIKALLEERFYAAYCTDPAHPWQQQIAILFERGSNLVQALVFLLDFGHPWQGAIKDFFPTHSMTPRQFQREFIDSANRHEVEQRQVPYHRARKFILDALEANRKYKVKLPPEYHQFQAMVERRIVDPSPQTLAYAAEVDAQTEDEWGELTGEPIRGLEIIGPKGERMPVMALGDPNDDVFEDEIDDFNGLLAEVADYYDGLQNKLDEHGEYILPYDWLVDYLNARYEQGIEVDELNDYWLDLSDFLSYLDEGYDTPPTLADIQGYHLSEFITEFWDDNIEEELSPEERGEVVNAICDLYNYLAEQKHLLAKVARRVSEAAESIFEKPGQLTPIPRLES